MKLKDKVAVITGSGRGIGKEAAILFSTEGASVVIAEIDEKSGKSTESKIREKGGSSLFIKTDISNPIEVKKMVNKVTEKFGGIHILYNNAAIFLQGKDGKVTDIDEDIWEKIIAVNLRGTFLCCKYVIPIIINSGGGSVINTSSSAGIIGIPKCDAYTATKGAVISLTRSMGVEFAPYKVRVNCIAPVAIKTNMVLESNFKDPDFDETKFLSTTPVKRWGMPEEIAKLALFLASDDSSYIIGSVLIADGGITIQ